MAFVDILKSEIPLTKRYYESLKNYGGGRFEETPEELQRAIRKLKTVSLTASGLEQVDSLRLLLAATHVVAQQLLDQELAKSAKPKPLPKR